jgi:hypothetical protein
MMFMMCGKNIFGILIYSRHYCDTFNMAAAVVELTTVQ